MEGYSNPLWTALLGAAVALALDGADGIPLLKILGLGFGLGTLLLTVPAARVAYPADARVSWVAAALLGALTPFVFWTASGMENALFAFLMLLAVTLQLRELQDSRSRQWSSMAIAALGLTRPEGMAFFLAFLVHRLICGERGIRVIRWAGVVLIVYAVFLAVRVLVFGEWVPNTYYAKVDIYDRQLSNLGQYLLDVEDRGTRYVLEFTRSTWLLLLVAAAGLLARPWQASLLITGILAGTVLNVVYVGGDFWPAARFFTAALPLLTLAAQHAVNRLPPVPPLAASILAALLVGIVLHQNLIASANLHVLNAGDALISLQGRLKNARRVQAVADALAVSEPLVLDPDVGGPAVAGLHVLDLGGLTDVHIARFHYYPPFFRAYVFEERRPHFIRTHATWTASSRITEFREFRQQYAPIRSWRDEHGLHGEFVRRDLLDRASRVRDRRPGREPSWKQAIEDGRARRRKEATRDRSRAVRPDGPGGR